MGKNKKKTNTQAGNKRKKQNGNEDDLHRQQREYWNDYYGKQDREEDFYKDEWDAPYFLRMISSLSFKNQVRKKDTVTLVPGCGMSSLSMKLHSLEDCKFKVFNIDISKKAIEEMKNLDKDNNWNMSWEEMSMDKMDKFQDGYFDVIIDKAASDFTVPPNDPQKLLKFQRQRSTFLSNYLSEVRRLLKVGGTFVYFLALEVWGEHEKTCSDYIIDSMLVDFIDGWDVIIHGPGDGKQPIQNGKPNMVMVFSTKTTSQRDPSMVKWDIHIDCNVGKTLKLFQVVELENEKRGYLSIYSEEDPKRKWNHNSKWILKGPENISSHRRLHFNLGKYEGLGNDIKYNALLFDIHKDKDDESQSRNYSVLCVPEKILREWHALSREDQLRFVLKLNTTRLLMIFSGKWSNDEINWEGAIRKYFSSLSKLAPKKREDEVVIRRFGGASFSCVEAKYFPIVGRVKLERKGGNHEFLPQKNPNGKNFVGKTNTEAQDPSLNQKTRDEATPRKETKDNDDVLIEHNTGSGHLDQDNDKIHRAFIGFCVNYFEDMGSTAAARTLEKESGYFSRKHFEDLVHHRRWMLVDYYLSHFFDVGKSAMLTKIESWAFMDDLKRRRLPLPEPKWFEPDYPQKASISSELNELIRGKLKMRDELKLPQESVLWSHFTKSQTCEGSDLVGASTGEMKDDVLIEDNHKIPRVIIRSFLDCFNEMGFTETSRILEKKFGYFSKRRFEELIHFSSWTLLEEYLSRFFDIGESALLSKIKTWAFMDNLKRRGLPLPEPEWFKPDYKQEESIISALLELIQGKLKTRDELKLPQESDLWRSLISSSRLTYEGSDLIGVHRRPPEERTDIYKKLKKMTIYDKILVEGKSFQVREGMYDEKQAMIKCIDLLGGKVAIREKELSTLKELEGHENVVKYYGVEWEEDSCFIALETCSFTLHDFFDDEKNFWNDDDPRTMLLSLIKDIIKGLEYLHSNGLIHRGLNPNNIMIKKECGKLRAKLSNMGSSKRLGGASSTTNTPNNPHKSVIDDDDDDDIWKAPEQKKNDKKVGSYVDLYSLGYIIHFCLTEGRHPQDVGCTSNLEDCPIEQLLCMLVKDFPEAYDIVSQLMSPQKYNRPRAEQVLKHIFLWDSTKRNLFMRHASDRLHKEKEDHKNRGTRSPILKELEKMKRCIFNGRSTWDVEIDPVFSAYLKCENRQPKDSDNDKGNEFESRTVYSLVRVIRNKSGHFHDLPENVLNLIPGRSADRIEEYFIKIFPRLLLEVYKIVLKFWKNDPTLKPYFA